MSQRTLFSFFKKAAPAGTQGSAQAAAPRPTPRSEPTSRDTATETASRQRSWGASATPPTKRAAGQPVGGKVAPPDDGPRSSDSRGQSAAAGGPSPTIQTPLSRTPSAPWKRSTNAHSPESIPIDLDAEFPLDGSLPDDPVPAAPSPVDCFRRLKRAAPAAAVVSNTASSDRDDVALETSELRHAAGSDLSRAAFRPTSACDAERDRQPPGSRPQEGGDQAAERKRARRALLCEDIDSKGATAEAWEEARSKFRWLAPENIKDARGRRPGHPDYDARTVSVPRDAMERFSKSQQQYWACKAEFMDTVLFFKVGKFYELYELDAEIGHRELDWKLTVSGVGKCRQVGCPESGIEQAIEKLVSRGYKVACMEQVESSQQARDRGGPSALVKRKLGKVHSLSTKTEGHLPPEALHLMALIEEPLTRLNAMTANYSAHRRHAPDGPGGDGEENLACGDESCVLSFAFCDAAVGKFCAGSVRDDDTRAALGALMAQVKPQELLLEARNQSDRTRKLLQRCCGPSARPMQMTVLTPAEFQQPSESDTSALGDVDEVLGADVGAKKALGALLCHLRRLKSEAELTAGASLHKYAVYSGALRLDGPTLANLELLENSEGLTRQGTLLALLDCAVTAFGRRAVRQWICQPLRSVPAINDRLDALEELQQRPDLCCRLREALARLPDVERMVGRARTAASGADSEVFISARRGWLEKKAGLLANAVLALRESERVFEVLADDVDGQGAARSRLLAEALAVGREAAAAAVLEELVAQLVVPCRKGERPGVRVDLDSQADKDDPEAVEALGAAVLSLASDFNEHSFRWARRVEALVTLDVLCGFAVAASAASGHTCRPQFVERRGRADGSILDMEGLWHPYAVSDGTIVPNSLVLGNAGPAAPGGGGQPRAILLTGANMGGKSTLLRAACVSVIMAQMGCWVPARRCRLSVVDTVFTRIGATDRIMSGESTFMVECSETANILRKATPDSLVVLDELGRGTSTFDGYAIAHAVLLHLVRSVGCRLLFATHFHSLTEEFAGDARVGVKHMGCATVTSAGRGGRSGHEQDALAAVDQDIVFTYRLEDGPCEKSYGLQVAKLAGIPSDVVRAAGVAAAAMEARTSSAFSTAAAAALASHVLAAASDGATPCARLRAEWQRLQRAVASAPRHRSHSSAEEG